MEKVILGKVNLVNLGGVARFVNDAAEQIVVYATRCPYAVEGTKEGVGERLKTAQKCLEDGFVAELCRQLDWGHEPCLWSKTHELSVGKSIDWRLVSNGGLIVVMFEQHLNNGKMAPFHCPMQGRFSSLIYSEMVDTGA
jgi:hypothetical protein